jgi:hypothetical protein
LTNSKNKYNKRRYKVKFYRKKKNLKLPSIKDKVKKKDKNSKVVFNS